MAKLGSGPTQDSLLLLHQRVYLPEDTGWRLCQQGIAEEEDLQHQSQDAEICYEQQDKQGVADV